MSTNADTSPPSASSSTLRQIRLRIVRTARIDNIHLYRRIIILIRTLRWPNTRIALQALRASSNIRMVEQPLEQRQSRQGLVKGNLMTGIVDSHEAILARLLHGTVDLAIRSCEVFVAGGGPAWGVDFGGDGFASDLLVFVRRMVCYMRW